jgi:hypothetical protein
MTAFTSMTCRVCGEAIDPDPVLADAPVRANGYAACIYRCGCGAGYSNARDAAARRLVWCAPELNVPAEVRVGVLEVLAQAVNITNRPQKREKFCSEMSEDAVTWTVIRALQSLGRLDILAGRAATGSAPSLLLWGVPVGLGADARVADELAAVSRSIGESANYRSEPDVILAWPDLVMFVEAKYRSPNEERPNRRGFDRYLECESLFAVSAAAVRAAGFYELTRNWRIGSELADRLDRRFTLLNLGSSAIEASASRFASLLNQGERRLFQYQSWAELLRRTRKGGSLPAWLARHADTRGLESD